MQKFSGLLHHIYAPERLRAAYQALKRDAAAGVDGQTWQSYGQALEANLLALSDRLARGVALRAGPAHGIREGEQLKKGERRRRHLVFAIKILDDFARTGTITRFAVETTGLRIPLAMHKPLREYEQYARERRHLRRASLAERMHCIAVFLDFLRSRGLESLDRLQADDIGAFIQSRSIWNPKTPGAEPDGASST